MSSTLEAIERETSKLRPEEQLELVGHLIHRLKASKTKAEDTRIDPLELYGTCNGLWEMDAQEYVNKMREDRF